MAIPTLLPVRILRWSFRPGQLFFAILLMISLLACTQGGQSGGQKRIRVDVGQIKEISLPAPSDSTVQVVGTSDNSEIVDVSPKQSAAEASVPKSDNMIFLIKGVTVGTAKVIFSAKQTGSPGADRVVRTYVVQVATK